MSRTKTRIQPTEYTEGQRVCMAGIGTDILAHRHGTVERLTKTMVIVRDKRGIPYRFTRGAIGRSVPFNPYGGTRIHPTCQRPKRGGSR